LHRVMFELFGMEVRTYSLAMGCAFVLATVMFWRRSPREQIDPNFAFNLAILCFVGMLVGGRVMYVINTWKENFATADRTSWQVFLETLKMWQGGLVFYGGFFAATSFVWIYCRVKKQAFLPVADLLAPYIGLGLSVHRSLGCYMNGCCFGEPTTLPWGVHFPLDTQPTREWGIETAVHPTQLYMAFNGLFLYLFLRWFRQFKRGHGEVFALLFMLYSIDRGLIEIFRGDKIRGHVPMFDLFYLAIFVAGLILWLYARGMTPRRKWAEWTGMAIFLGAGAVGLFGGAGSDSANDVTAATPFSTSQYLGFFTFAAGAAVLYYSRFFGQRVQPEYGTLPEPEAEPPPAARSSSPA